MTTTVGCTFLLQSLFYFLSLITITRRTNSQAYPDSWLVYDYLPFPYGTFKTLMSYPVGCFKIQFGLDNYYKAECVYAGTAYLMRISTCGADSSCSSCALDRNWGIDAGTGMADTDYASLPTGHVGHCHLTDPGVNKDDYMQIAVYADFDQFRTTPCNPTYEYNDVPLKFATDICFETGIGTGVFQKAVCNGGSYAGAVNTYTNSLCTLGETVAAWTLSGSANKAGAYSASYESKCEELYQPEGGISEWIEQRLETCYVDGVNTILPSPSPTSHPSGIPSATPSAQPSSLPPTNLPSTGYPSTMPSGMPSGQPSSAAPSSGHPSVYPTRNPITTSLTPTLMPSAATSQPTGSPTASPTKYQGVEVGSIKFNQMTTIYIVGGVIFAFYFFICLYIWCNERQKRKNLVSNYQKGKDRAARMEWLRAKKQEQQRVQMQQQFQQRPEEFQRQPQQEFDAQLMSEGVR